MNAPAGQIWKNLGIDKNNTCTGLEYITCVWTYKFIMILKITGIIKAC